MRVPFLFQNQAQRYAFALAVTAVGFLLTLFINVVTIAAASSWPSLQS